MKTAKRKIYQTLITFVFVILQCVMSVHAEELTQSEESVSVNLAHEHTQDVCWTRTWVPCGGWWGSYFEEYVGATVYYCSNCNSSEIRNGVRLSQIHSGWEYKEHTGWHDGEYANRRICDQTIAGVFTVTKISPGEGNAEGTAAELVASVTSEDVGLSDTSFWWECPDHCVVEGDRVTISQNGVYSAMVRWRDNKTEVYHTTALDYVEISNPITLVFQSGGEVLDEVEVSYGDPLPEIEIPVKEGYLFKGYYVGLSDDEENTGEAGGENEDATAWYDGEGKPDRSVTITSSALEEILTAQWEARSYHVYYGEDSDGDGRGDSEFDAVYGEEYGPVEVDGEKRDGFVFDGYYLGSERVFDAAGQATGVWRWDGEGDIVLEAVYHRKTDSSSGHGDYEEEKEEPEPFRGVSDNGIQENGVSDNSISDNSISENSISENNISGNGTSGGGLQDERSESGRGNDYDRADGGSHGHSGNQEDRNLRPFYDGHSAGGDTDAADAASRENTVTQEMFSQRISENAALGKTTEAGVLRSGSIVVRTLEVAGITAGILGLAYLTGWMVIMKASFAELFSIRADDTKRRLGIVLILHGENAYHIRMKERMLEQGETGKYRIIFRKRFALKHANQDIIIHCGEKEISEIIRPEIIFFTE